MASGGGEIELTRRILFWPAAKVFKNEDNAETFAVHDTSRGYGAPVPGEPSPGDGVSPIPVFLSATPCGWYNPIVDVSLQDDLNDPEKLIYIVAIRYYPNMETWDTSIKVSEFSTLNAARTSIGLPSEESLENKENSECEQIDRDAWNRYAASNYPYGASFCILPVVKCNTLPSLPYDSEVVRWDSPEQHIHCVYDGVAVPNAYLVQNYRNYGWHSAGLIYWIGVDVFFNPDPEANNYVFARLPRPHPEGIPEVISGLMETGRMALASSAGMVANSQWDSRMMITFLSVKEENSSGSSVHVTSTVRTVGIPVYRFAFPSAAGSSVVEAEDPLGVVHNVSVSSSYFSTDWMIWNPDAQKLETHDLGLLLIGSTSFSGEFNHVVDEPSDSIPGLNLDLIYHGDAAEPDQPAYSDIERLGTPEVPDRRYDASYLDWDPIYND